MKEPGSARDAALSGVMTEPSELSDVLAKLPWVPIGLATAVVLFSILGLRWLQQHTRDEDEQMALLDKAFAESAEELDPAAQPGFYGGWTDEYFWNQGKEEVEVLVWVPQGACFLSSHTCRFQRRTCSKHNGPPCLADRHQGQGDPCGRHEYDAGRRGEGESGHLRRLGCSCARFVSAWRVEAGAARPSPKARHRDGDGVVPREGCARERQTSAEAHRGGHHVAEEDEVRRDAAQQMRNQGA
eukprot:scaffold535_cov260-Pinguiococcus_pyrenoidosus.AAC.12